MRNRRLVFWAVLATSLITGTVVVAEGRSSLSDIMSLIHRPTDAYPAVVARVNSHEITGSWLAYQVALVQDQAAAEGRAAIEATAIQTGLDLMINKWIVYDEAVRLGFTATKVEIDGYLAEQATRAAQMGDPDVLAASVLAVNGQTSFEEYLADPRTRQLVREILVSRKLLVVVSTEPGFSIDAYRQGLRDRADIEIFVKP